MDTISKVVFSETFDDSTFAGSWKGDALSKAEKWIKAQVKRASKKHERGFWIEEASGDHEYFTVFFVARGFEPKPPKK